MKMRFGMMLGLLALVSTTAAQTPPLAGAWAQSARTAMYPVGRPETSPAREGASRPDLSSRANVPPESMPSPSTVWVTPGDPIPLRQWVERPGPTTPSDKCNSSSDSTSIWNVEFCGAYPPAKHMRMFYHAPSTSMVIAGGDHAVSMPHPGYYDATGSEIVAVNVATNKWKIVRPFCVPGEPQPERPDTVGWAYDSKRDRGLMTPGYYFVGYKSGCGAIDGLGGYAFDFKTKKFSGPDDAAGLPVPPDGWGGDGGASFSVYDPISDELVRIRNGPRLEALNLATKKWRLIPLSRSDVGRNWNPVPNRGQPAIDVRGRAVYWLDAALAGNPPVLVSGGSPALIKVNLTNGAVTAIPLPAQHQVALSGNDLYLVFDPINRLVLIPNNVDMGVRPIVGLGIYHVDSGRWEWETPPPAVAGSAWGFDENVGALVGIGKRSQPTAYYFWKYGPKP